MRVCSYGYTVHNELWATSEGTSCQALQDGTGVVQDIRYAVELYTQAGPSPMTLKLSFI